MSPALAYVGALPTTSPRVFALTSVPDGGWPTNGQPWYFSSGYTYFGFVDNAGHVKAARFKHADGSVSLFTLATLAADQHNQPAILRRSSDGKLLAAYCEHGGGDMYLRISSNVDDVSAWSSQVGLDGSLHGTSYTYPTLFETDAGIVMLYRDIVSGISYWKVARSTDNGATWIDGGEICHGTRAYAKMFKTSDSRLDFVATDGQYCEDKASLYHAYQDQSTGTWYKTDGTALPTPPISFATGLTKIYDGATNGVQGPWAIVCDGTNIAVVFSQYTGSCSGHIGADADYKYAYWNGSAWSVHTIVSAVGATSIEFTVGALAIDPADLSRVVLSKRDGSSIWQISEYSTSDHGSTWSSSVRTATANDNMYPLFVNDHQPELEYIWLQGSFTDDTTYNDAVIGYGVPA